MDANKSTKSQGMYMSRLKIDLKIPTDRETD